ncbi:MAG: helix-turn-helix transcriptional regulator [bacterium]
MSEPYASIDGVPRLGSGIPLIARTGELEQLHAALQRAHDGVASAVLLSGDAGVGKSRVAAEFAEQTAADGALVFTGRCLGVGDAGLPYLPFAEVVEQLRAEHADVLADRPVLAGLTGDGGGPNPAQAAGAHGDDLSQLQLFDAMLDALATLGAGRVVVLVLEDLHWADPSSRDLLSFLLSRLNDQRLLVLATYRSDDLHRRHPLRPLLAELVRLPAVERLPLQPFGHAEAREFVQALADETVGERVIADVAERSEGNAFFAEELLAASAAHGGIPTALADVLLTRVEQLSPVAQRVVRAASVTGRHHVRHSTLGTVLEIPEEQLEDALLEAVQHHVLVPSEFGADAYAFRHSLLREAVYADLLPGERVRLHAAYARIVAELPQPKLAEALAHHSVHSNDLPTALSASVQAARYAMGVGAFSAALRHLEQVVELWDAVDDPETRGGIDKLGLYREAMYVAGSAGQPERALAYGRAALPLADERQEPSLRADVRRQVAEILVANGRWQEAERTLSEAWDLVRDEPASRERSWVLALLARTWRRDDVRRFGEAAIEDARASRTPGAEADAYISLAFSEQRQGRIEQACTQLEQAREVAVRAGAPDVELRALYHLTVTRHEQGRLDAAAQHADEGSRRASELGLTWSAYGLDLRWMQAMAHYARGSWDDAERAASAPGEHVSDTISGLLAASRAIVRVARGDFAAASTDLVHLRPEWHRDSQIAQLAGIAGAELACWQGDPETATATVDDALDSMRARSGSGWPMGGIRLATLGIGAQADLALRARRNSDGPAEKNALATGERLADYAAETAERGKPRASEIGPEGRAWLARMRAEHSRLLGENDPDLWAEVIRAFDYGEVYHQALARWRQAEALVARGERAVAAEQLASALAVAERLRAVPLADACRALAGRARLPLPGAVPSAPDTLTPREAAVLRLVAQGRTNRQIGEQLFISEKTVSVHLSRVMSKLGAGSRTEAVSVAYQRGLLAD